MQLGGLIQETHTNIRDATPDGQHHKIHLVEVNAVGPYMVETVLTLSRMRQEGTRVVPREEYVQDQWEEV